MRHRYEKYAHKLIFPAMDHYFPYCYFASLSLNQEKRREDEEEKGNDEAVEECNKWSESFHLCPSVKDSQKDGKRSKRGRSSVGLQSRKITTWQVNA